MGKFATTKLLTFNCYTHCLFLIAIRIFGWIHSLKVYIIKTIKYVFNSAETTISHFHSKPLDYQIDESGS